MNIDHMASAYTQRYEKRWWIFHWTPAGMVVRLIQSYPDKGSALAAIGMLGYQEVPVPGSALDRTRTTYTGSTDQTMRNLFAGKGGAS